jgi:hypothetical protein
MFMWLQLRGSTCACNGALTVAPLQTMVVQLSPCEGALPAPASNAYTPAAVVGVGKVAAVVLPRVRQLCSTTCAAVAGLLCS